MKNMVDTKTVHDGSVFVSRLQQTFLLASTFSVCIRA